MKSENFSQSLEYEFQTHRQCFGMIELFTSHRDFGKMDIQSLLFFLKKIRNDQEESSDLL